MKVDEPDVLADLRHADALTGEDVTEIHLASRKQIRPHPVTMIIDRYHGRCSPTSWRS